jgi:hypothetical protein
MKQNQTSQIKRAGQRRKKPDGATQVKICGEILSADRGKETKN